MDVIKLLLTAEKTQSICFLCFEENVDGLNVDDGIDICDEIISGYSTSMRTITNDLFPSYDIITGHSCEICTKLMIEMYTTINRAMNKITLIQQLTEKIYNELSSKSLLVRNKMTINLKENVPAKESTQNEEVVYNKRTKTMEADSICDLCGKSFNRPNLLKIHLTSHTETQCSSSYKIDNKKPTRRNVSSMFNCNECDYKTVNKQDFKSHINKQHLNLRPYACKICHKRFFSNKNLREHCLIHKRVKNMVCDICGERFSYRKSLEFHMKSHLNDRPFPCVVCGHSFVSVSQRNEHVKRKHGPKDFVCDLCDSKYSLRKELKRHVKNIHKSVI